MQYNRFIELCHLNGEKPTPLILKLGLSSGNLKRWENGATVNSDILCIISDHFNVSVDYLLGRTNNPAPLKRDYTQTDEIRNKIEHLSPERRLEAENHLDYLLYQDKMNNEGLKIKESLRDDYKKSDVLNNLDGIEAPQKSNVKSQRFKEKIG